MQKPKKGHPALRHGPCVGPLRWRHVLNVASEGRIPAEGGGHCGALRCNKLIQIKTRSRQRSKASVGHDPAGRPSVKDSAVTSKWEA